MADDGRISAPDHLLPPHTNGLGGLVRELAGDVGALLQQEIALAKLEIKQALTASTLDAVKIMVALSLAAVGGLCLVVFMVLGIAVLLDGAYWAGALITGAFLLLVGGLLSLSAIRDLKRQSLAPHGALDGLRTDGGIARAEAKAVGKHVSRGVAAGAGGARAAGNDHDRATGEG
ncbi:MAG: phage holin family protein [Longimicrobiales bacterium]